MSSKSSVIPHFRSLSVADRRRVLAAVAAVDEAEITDAVGQGGLAIETADKMIENAIGTLALPFGIALNVQVNGADYLVPMAIEEPSVIAAASHASKRVRAAGGFQATMDASLMAAQIEIHDVPSAEAALANVRVPHRQWSASQLRPLAGGA